MCVLLVHYPPFVHPEATHWQCPAAAPGGPPAGLCSGRCTAYCQSPFLSSISMLLPRPWQSLSRAGRMESVRPPPSVWQQGRLARKAATHTYSQNSRAPEMPRGDQAPQGGRETSDLRPSSRAAPRRAADVSPYRHRAIFLAGSLARRCAGNKCGDYGKESASEGGGGVR